MNIYWYRRVLTVFSISLWGPVPRCFSNVLGHLWLTSGFPQELTPWGPHPAGGLTHQGSCTKAQLPVSILSHSAGESQLELLMGLSGTFYKTALYFCFSSGLCCFLHFLTGIVLNSPIHFLQKNLYLKICFPGTQPKTIGARRGLERKPVVCWLLLEHWSLWRNTSWFMALANFLGINMSILGDLAKCRVGKRCVLLLLVL